MAEKFTLTQEGFDKIQAEYDELISVRRAEIAEKLKEARSYGDLSENAEYDAARDEQRDVEARIEELENILKNVVVVIFLIKIIKIILNWVMLKEVLKI